LERGCFYHPGDLGWEQYRSEYARRTVDGTLLVGHAAEAAGPAEAAGGGSE
jgi:hypothetical protein